MCVYIYINIFLGLEILGSQTCRGTAGSVHRSWPPIDRPDATGRAFATMGTRRRSTAKHQIVACLVGGIPTPLKNMKSVGRMIPRTWKKNGSKPPTRYRHLQ